MISYLVFASLAYKLIITDIDNCDNAKKFYHKKILLSKIKNDLKSGDLILFKNHNVYALSNLLGNKIYSHMGIIVKCGGSLYVYEILNGEITPNTYPNGHTGTILSRFDDRINQYSGNIYIAKLTKSLTQKQQEKLRELCNQNLKYYKILDFIKDYYLRVKPNRTYCYQLTMRILKDINVCQCPINTINQPLEMLSKNINNLWDNKIYEHPIEVIPDKLMI